MDFEILILFYFGEELEVEPCKEDWVHTLLYTQWMTYTFQLSLSLSLSSCRCRLKPISSDFFPSYAEISDPKASCLVPKWVHRNFIFKVGEKFLPFDYFKNYYWVNEERVNVSRINKTYPYFEVLISLKSHAKTQKFLFLINAF